MAAGAAGLFSPAAPHRLKQSPCDRSGMIATAFELLPLLVIDVPAVSSEAKANLDLGHRPNGNVPVPGELLPTSFGTAFCDIRCY